MINRDIYIYMAISDRTYVSDTHAHVRVSRINVMEMLTPWHIVISNLM